MHGYTKEEISEDLALLVKAGLIDIRMREDGEWVYSASEYSLTLSPEEIRLAIENIEDQEL